MSAPGNGRADAAHGPRRVVLLGAAGTVGGWYLTHLTGPGDTVTTADLADGTDHPGDVRVPCDALRAAVAAADEIALALPEDIAAGCLPWLAAEAGAEAVLVSTCSVQQTLFMHAAELRAPQELRGVVPMFSPTLPSAGQPVVLVAPEAPPGRGDDSRPGAEDPHVERMRRRLEAGGMIVSVLDPHVHDTAMSSLQALPHAAVLAFVDALLATPVDVPTLMAMAPPPARTLVALACRILAAPPEIYWDIQRANAESGARRKELAASLARLDELVDTGRSADFRASLAAAAEGLGAYAGEGADECRDLFERIQQRRLAAGDGHHRTSDDGPGPGRTPHDRTHQPGDR